MRRAGLLLVAVLSACGDDRPLELDTIVFTDTVRIACLDGGVACERSPRLIGAPMCGYGFGSLSDGSPVTLDLAQRRDTVQGLFQEDVVFQPASGDAVPLGSLRGVLVDADAGLLYSVIDRSPLFVFSSSGAVTVLPSDGGVAVPGTVATLVEPLDDGGVMVATETLSVVSASRRTVAVRDHQSDPFYGCCAHVDALAPGLALAFLAGPLLRRRVARRR
jgi:hypothetical protein